MNRRDFLSTVAAAGAACMIPVPAFGFADNTFQFNCFTKHLQWLDYFETAELLKNAGYDGADLTVRPDGHVEPERVEEDLPKAVAAFEAVGLKIPMIVTHVTRADDTLMEKVLRVARAQKVKLYRMGYLNYDEKLGIEKSIDNLRPQMQELADLNREIGITGAYQNHAGTRFGGPVWDLHLLFKGLNPQYLGIQYDIKHAVAEGGHAWILGLKLVAEQINCLVLKDFLWQQDNNGDWSDNAVPLGTGMVDYDLFFATVKELGIRVPITLHLEYEMPHQLQVDISHAEKKEKELAVYKRDLEAAKELMNKVGLI